MPFLGIVLLLVTMNWLEPKLAECCFLPSSSFFQQNKPKVIIKFQYLQLTEKQWRLGRQWELSDLRGVWQSKMEAMTINTSLGMRQWALNSPLSTPLGTQQHINQNPITHALFLHIHTHPWGYTPAVHQEQFSFNLNCLINIITGLYVLKDFSKG